MENIRYLVWKIDNSLIITKSIDEILNVNKEIIKSITKENVNDRTYISQLYYNKDNKTPDDIIEKYNSLYYKNLDLLEPYHILENDIQIIKKFNN